MSKFSDFVKEQKQKDKDFFFNGGWKKESNQYFTFKRVVNDDEIIITTNNVQHWKSGQYVLVVDNDKVVYLKEWQVRPVKNFDLLQNSYVVKLNKNYFKSYKLSFELNDFAFDKEDTFEDLKETAREQERANIKWAFGRL